MIVSEAYQNNKYKELNKEECWVIIHILETKLSNFHTHWVHEY